MAEFEEEIWIDVVGYEGFYVVSSFGSVKSLDRLQDCCLRHTNKRNIKGKIKKPQKDKKTGNLFHTLCKNGVCKRMLVHRIVAEAFMPAYNLYKYVQHVDYDLSNNHIKNLILSNQTRKNRVDSKRKYVNVVNKKSNEFAYVYSHHKADSGDIFYVGIAKFDNFKYKRARNFVKRSELWKNIQKKHGVYFNIIDEKIPMCDALEKEISLISKYGRIDIGTGVLCNLTAGGEGANSPSLELRRKLSKINKGRVIPQEIREKISKSLKRVGHKPPRKKSCAGENSSHHRIILNQETGVFYFGTKDASSSIENVKQGLLDAMIRGRLKNKTSFLLT